ncbi:tyrosine-type recombinase/integrase [Vibrio parahaemolyticus]
MKRTTTMTVMGLFKQYNKQLRASDSHKLSCESMARILNKLIGQKRVNKISQQDFHVLFTEVLTTIDLQTGQKGYSESSLSNFRSYLKQVWRFGYNAGLIADKDMPRIGEISVKNLGRSRAAIRYYDDDTIRKIFTVEELSMRLQRNLFLFGYLTGLRPSELIGLAWSDVKFITINDGMKLLEVAQITINRSNVVGKYKEPKTPNSRRTLDLCERATSILREQAGMTSGRAQIYEMFDKSSFKAVKYEDDFVFHNPATQKAWSHANEAYDSIRELFVHLGIEERYRGLQPSRHTYTTKMVRAGVDFQTVARDLGHSNVTTLQRHYADFTIKDFDLSKSLVRTNALLA